MAHAPSLTSPTPSAVSPDGSLKIYHKGTDLLAFLNKPATVQDAVAIFEFEGVPFRSVTLDGRRLVPASEQGRALGYQDGRHYVNSIREWMEQGELRPDEHVVRIEGEALKRVKGLSADPALSRAASLIMLTEQGVIRAALLAGGPKALRFRDYATGVMFNVITTGAHVERGAPVEIKPLPTVAAELRRIGDRLWRAGRRDEATDCYLRAGEVGLGRAFLTTTPAPAATQLELPLPPAAPEPAPAAPPAPATPKVDQPGDDWGGFVAAWSRKYGVSTQEDETVVSAADLLALAAPFIKVIGGPQAGRPARFGKMLMARLDHVFGGLRIVHRNSTIRGYALYKAPRK